MVLDLWRGPPDSGVVGSSLHLRIGREDTAMALPRKTLRPAVLATAALFGATTLATPLREARADGTSIGKGVVGGSLAGADVVTIVESLAGVHAGWAYAVGAIVGAGGGGVGGYFIGNGSDDGKAPTYLLAAGMALIIPAIVLTLNGTRYIPEEGATEDRAPTAPAPSPERRVAA